MIQESHHVREDKRRVQEKEHGVVNIDSDDERSVPTETRQFKKRM